MWGAFILHVFDEPSERNAEQQDENWQLGAGSHVDFQGYLEWLVLPRNAHFHVTDVMVGRQFLPADLKIDGNDGFRIDSTRDVQY